MAGKMIPSIKIPLSAVDIASARITQAGAITATIDIILTDRLVSETIRAAEATSAKPGNVLVWSGEDDPSDTLLPRLLAQGADRNRVCFVGEVLADGKKRQFDPARDMGALTRAAKGVSDVRFLIIDPIVNAVMGDGHNNTEVRRSLQPVVELAAQLKAAVLVLPTTARTPAGAIRLRGHWFRSVWSATQACFRGRKKD